jgi:hypothetical protein
MDDQLPRGTEWDGEKLQHTVQNDSEFKTYELFISGIFHLIFWKG